MELEHILYSKEDAVATITINRPRMKNALNFKAVGELADALEQAGRDKEVRAVIVTGAGNVFCAGGERHELAELQHLSPLEIKETIYGAFQRVVRALRNMPKPAVAAINGDAVGAGFDLCLACDIRIASTTARFSEFFIRLGTVPGMCGMYMLPRIVGLGKAAELAFTGDFIDAQEAYRIGLVNKTVPPEELKQEAWDMAERLAKGPTVVIALVKTGLNRSFASDLESELEFAALLQGAAVKTEDHREGIQAAIEKRAPVFKGKL